MRKYSYVWVILMPLLVMGAAPVAAVNQPELKIRIAVPEGNMLSSVAGDPHSPIDTNSYFDVVIENVSSRPQKIIDQWNSWGYFNISFEYTTANGEKKVMQKDAGEWARNFITTTTLNPGEATIWEITYNQNNWSNSPVPKNGKNKVKIHAIFEQVAKDDNDRQNPQSLHRRAVPDAWHGKIESPEMELEFINN